MSVVKRFIKAMIRLYYAKYKFVTQDTVIRRRELCFSCEHRKGLFCIDCKCLIPAKIRLSTEWCPQDKWSIASFHRARKDEQM